MVYFVSLDPGVYLADRMYLLGGARKMPKLARKVFKCGDCQEKSRQRKNLGFTDLSPFGREMLNVKVATDKDWGRIWNLQAVLFPFRREMQNVPFGESKISKSGQTWPKSVKRTFNNQEDRV